MKQVAEAHSVFLINDFVVLQLLLTYLSGDSSFLSAVRALSFAFQSLRKLLALGGVLVGCSIEQQ